MREAAWPAIRSDLGLDYAAIGALLTIPGLLSGFLEPALGLLGDSGKRRPIVAAGGIAFATSLVLVANAGTFAALLVAFMLLYPASGAFVSLSQANLMDLEPADHERNMARWVLAGSVGVVLGPLFFTLATRMDWNWRPVFLVLGLATAPMIFLSGNPSSVSVATTHAFQESASAAWRAMRNRRVLRWLLLLELTDLMGDVLTGFLAIYFVDVVHASMADAAVAVLVWSLAGLVGDALLVPLLTRISGVTCLRFSAALAAGVYPGFLLVQGPASKLLCLAVLGMLHAGWYAIPQARLYGELEGHSGVAIAVSNVAGLPAHAFPVLLGALAVHFGLGVTLWCCMLAPVGLLLGLPSRTGEIQGSVKSA